MASPYQQQVFQRKLWYIGLIVVLFTVTLLWRRGVMDAQARELAIREESRGDVELSGAVVRLALTGSRGLATTILWTNAIEMQKKNRYNELEVLVRSITKLQPHFITPWLFQSWNLAYNVSVEADRPRDKYFYISRGIQLLAEGERQNRDHPDLRWSIGFYTQHKVGQSDETNVQRSIFQLSLIPPHERDPARFYLNEPKKDGALEFNWAEFEKFCADHPQLLRRLRFGMHRDTQREKDRQFTCETPEEVVSFLEANYQVPSLYKVELPPEGAPMRLRPWQPRPADQADAKARLAPEDRFPVLPPPHEAKPPQRIFDPAALADNSKLDDRVDAFGVSHAWYCYAQEPVPEPDELPGSTKEIVDRVRQRRPRYMTTLIFRDYPAKACRYMAERMQQEGWYDGEGWNATDWLRAHGYRGAKDVVLGEGRNSLEAWQRAHAAWRKHGEENHLVLSESAEQTMRERATRFHETYTPGYSKERATADQLRQMTRRGRKSTVVSQLFPAPQPMREERLTAEGRRQYRAAQFMFEWVFYRNVSNFEHHLTRAFVEARPETVAVRKALYQAEALALTGSPRALREYRRPRKDWPGKGQDKTLSALEAWAELVLKSNESFRDDDDVQRQTAELLVSYLRLYNRSEGRDMKRQLLAAAPALPLVPRFDPDVFRGPIVQGPFSAPIDPDHPNEPLLEPQAVQEVLSRLGLLPRPEATGAPPTGPAGMPTPPPAPR